MDVIDDLKERSGKTTKMKALSIVELDQELENVMVVLILMANISSKIAIVMKKAELEQHNIKEDGIFLLKNFHLVEQISGIPIFKVTNRTTVSQSRVLVLNSLTFTSDEVNNLKTSIDSQQYLDVNVNVNPPNPDNVPNTDVLTLAQFCKGNPGNPNSNQFVEVISSKRSI